MYITRRVFLFSFLILFIFVFVFCIFKFFSPTVKISKVTILGEETFKCEARIQNCSCYEILLDSATFQRYAQQKGWKLTRITKPFKILRYTIVLGQFCKDYEGLQNIYEANVSQETPYSYYHFISEGFYYMEEDTHHTLHVAYDAQTRMLYYYSRNTRGGGDIVV